MSDFPEATRATSGVAALRRHFWTHFLDRHPAARLDAPGNQSSRWRSLAEERLVVAHYVSKRGVGVFIRGEKGVAATVTASRLAPIAPTLSSRLGADFVEDSRNIFLQNWLTIDMKDEANWSTASDWLIREVDRYQSILKAVMSGKAEGRE